MTTANKAIEKITTGLTPNYLHDWSLEQALREAVQNIAYGAVKSGKDAKIYYDSKEQLHVIRDYHTGLEKKHLYIGESGQRDDTEGLGNFGEGWKIFLLIMARSGIKHYVKTVGFTFWGSLEPTAHETEVLVINVQENDNTKGTKVAVDLPWEDVRKATESFAVLQGIPMEYINVESIIPDRKGELWVQGVRIENNETTNPLNLHYSYNLRQRNLINRDRSHPNAELAYREIRTLIFNMPLEMIKEYVSLALAGVQKQDILRGPNVGWESDKKKDWMDALAELHACESNQLVIKSSNPAVNDEAKKQGYVLLDVPSQWNYEMSYLGIHKADLVLEDRYDVVETGYSGGKMTEGKTPLAKAKLKIKKALDLRSVKDLPDIRYVQSIRKPSSEYQPEIFCQYDSTVDLIYIDVKILDDEVLTTKYLLQEVIRWRYDARTSSDFHNAYEEITLRLL